MARRAIVRTRANTRYVADINTGRHNIVADEPLDAGGDDLGPTPRELLLAAIGSCTTMTIQIYAETKGWPLTGVEVQVDYEKHSEPKPEGGTKSWETIDQRIVLHGDLTEEQRKRLLITAGKCPVHRTVANGALFSETLVDRLDEGA